MKDKIFTLTALLLIFGVLLSSYAYAGTLSSFGARRLIKGGGSTTSDDEAEEDVPISEGEYYPTDKGVGEYYPASKE